MNKNCNTNNHFSRNDDGINQHPDKEIMYDDWEGYQDYRHHYKKPDFEKIWQQIKQILGWDIERKVFLLLSPRLLRYAAAILLPILGFALGLYFSDGVLTGPPDDLISIETPRGVSTRVNLSDGSSVWLRPGSILTYPKQFDFKNRKLFLEGEAFFNVNTDKEWPFVVRAGSLDVVATGTKFMLKAFLHDDLVEAGLISGSVHIEWKDKQNKRLQQNIHLLEVVQFSNTKLAIVDKRNMSPRKANWNHYNLAFEGTSFGVMMEELAGWYNIELDVHPELPHDQPITMTVHEESLTEILEILQVFVDFNFHFSINRLYLYPG